jgi:hypothetical protein
MAVAPPHAGGVLMLRRLLRREPRRLFVGELGVAPRRDLLRRLEDGLFVEPMDLEWALLAELRGMLAVPPASDVADPGPADLACDIALQRLRRGQYMDVALWTDSVPVFWRPQVRLAVRLYELRSKKTKATFSVTQRMPWREFLYRVLSWRVLVRMESPALRSDMERLLHRAAERVKDRLHRKAA